MTDPITDLAPEELEEAPAAAEEIEEPEDAEAEAPVVEAEEPVVEDGRKARILDLLENGRPEVRNALLLGGSTNTPLEGPASPFRPR